MNIFSKSRKGICVLLILMLCLTSISFAENYKEVSIKDNNEDFFVEIKDGISLGEESVLTITQTQKTDNKILKIDLPKGVELTKGNLITSSKKTTHEISIKINEPGEYVIKIKSEDNEVSKDFRIKINDKFAVYGEAIDMLDLNIIEEDEMKINGSEILDLNIIGEDEIKSNAADKKTITPHILNSESSKIQDTVLSSVYNSKGNVESEEFEYIYEEEIHNKILDNNIQNKNYISQMNVSAASSSDLIAYDIVPQSTGPYMIDNAYDFKFYYANVGDTIAENITIGFYVNDNQMYVTTKDLDPHTMYVFTSHLTVRTPGTHDLEMRVDEGSGSPNILTESFVWSSKTGKGIEYLSLTTPYETSPYEAKEKVTFRSIVRNVGTEDTGSVDFVIYRDDDYLKRYTVDNILYGKFVVVQVDYTEKVQGNHTYKFVFDPDNKIDNDTHEKTISGYWNGNGPDIMPTDLSFNGSGNPTQGESSTFTFYLKNDGTSHINSTFYGKITANRIPYIPVTLLQYSVNSLNAGSSAMGEFTINGLSKGTWNFEHETDYSNSVSESNENNNIGTYDVTFNDSAVIEDGIWYSQIEPNTWDATNLDKLFVPNSSHTAKANTPFEWNKYVHGNYQNPNGNPSETSGHINKWGCVAASMAMVLKNEGAKTTSKYYDFRTNSTTYLEPDPFTVILANIHYPSIRSESGNYYIDDYTSSSSVTYFSIPNEPNRGKSEVASDYGYNVYRIELGGKSESEIASIINTTLAEHPEGIMARIKNQHTFVINRLSSQSTAMGLNAMNNLANAELNIEPILLTPEIERTFDREENILIEENSISKNGFTATVASQYDDDYIVTDPGTQQSTRGDNVLFTDSYSYSSYGGLSNLTYIEYIERK